MERDEVQYGVRIDGEIPIWVWTSRESILKLKKVLSRPGEVYRGTGGHFSKKYISESFGCIDILAPNKESANTISYIAGLPMPFIDNGDGKYILNRFGEGTKCLDCGE